MLLWMLDGPSAGKFVPVSEEEGHKLIEEGMAQDAKTSAHKIRKPNYQTRELVADDTATAVVKPVKRRKRAKKASESEAAEK